MSAFFFKLLFLKISAWGWSLLFSFGLRLQCLVYFLHDWAFAQNWRVALHSDWFFSMFFPPRYCKEREGGKIETVMRQHQGNSAQICNYQEPRVWLSWLASSCLSLRAERGVDSGIGRELKVSEKVCSVAQAWSVLVSAREVVGETDSVLSSGYS